MKHLKYTDNILPFCENDLRKLLTIRHFENALLNLFSAGKLKGTTHTCIGEEYVPVSLNPIMHEDDFVFSNHRGHGHFLARYNNPAGLLAEIMGKEGAICNGVGGSQHIYNKKYLSTGIQGESVAIAAGVALHNKMKNNNNCAFSYIGDGTWGEGCVYESLNMASLLNLPLVLIVENNGIAQTTPIINNMAGNIQKRAEAFDIDYAKIESTDINEIRKFLKPLILKVRTNQSPLIIEYITYRLGPHSKGDDTRDEEELKFNKTRDWFKTQQKINNPLLSKLDTEVGEYINEIVKNIELKPNVTPTNHENKSIRKPKPSFT